MMKEVSRKFTRDLMVFSLILGGFALLTWLLLPPATITPALPFLFIFFFAATILSFQLVIKSLGARFIKFVNTYMLTIVIKLFLYMGVMVVYMLLNRGDAIPFMAAFFILYLCYAIFEAVRIIRLTRSDNQDKVTG